MAQDASNLFAEIKAGKRPADDLYTILQADLRRIAGRLMRGERPDHTLQPTLIADEAFLRLIGGNPADWNDPHHFVALAARLMRQILIDHARRKKRKKRGGPRDRLPLDSALSVLEQTSGWADAEALDTALTRLAEIQPRAAQVVQMRFFGELTMEQIAAALECSLATAEREWRYARAWLRSQLSGDSHSKQGVDPE